MHFVQPPGAFYGIWGESRNDARHDVHAREERLSITFRFKWHTAGDARRWGGKPKALRAFFPKGSQRLAAAAALATAAAEA